MKKLAIHISIAMLLVVTARTTQASTENGEYLLHGFESSKGTLAFSWKLSGVKRLIVPGRFGNAMRVEALALIKGGKADIPVIKKLPKGVGKLKLWVFAPENKNERPAFFAWSGFDSEGESLMVKIPVDWIGWRQLELDVASAPWRQTYRRKDKNGKLDPPLKSLHLNWFSSAPTRQYLIFDQLTAYPKQNAELNLSGFPIDNLDVPAKIALGGRMSPVATFNNPTDKELEVALEYSLATSSDSRIPQAPDPLYGSDIAAGKPSKTIVNGEIVKKNSVTDGNRNTFAWKMASKGEKMTDAQQIIDLGRVVKPKWVAIRNSDANWIYKVDVEASQDGKSYKQIPGMSGITLFHKWGEGVFISTESPVPARYLKFHYHTRGMGPGTHGPGKVVDGGPTKHYKLPSIIRVYDGLNDENTELTRGADTLFVKKAQVKVPPRSFASVKLDIPAKLVEHRGCYILGGRTTINGKFKELLFRRFFVWAPAPLKPEPGDSPYGVNAADAKNAEVIRSIGFRNVRFENMKWYMCSTKPGETEFNGTIPPWRVNHDAILAKYHELGLKPLPMILGCPKWASSQPDKKRCFFYPPANPDDYRDFVFQLVARYGSAKIAADELTTSDKKTGLGWMDCFEIWNEPDLNHPRWGALVGDFKDYFPILRAGYEGAKKADPKCEILNGGLAGLSFNHWEEMRKFSYPDGKHPIDFIDIMNVHFYSGKNPPEVPSVNTNIDRGNGGVVEPSFQEQLERLVAWRNEHKKNAPIWLTENGWDTIGGRFVTETQQAAYLVRSMIIARNAGISRIYVYREKDTGSTLYASCGFTRRDGSFKPSAFSFSYLIARTDKARCVGRIPTPSKNIFAYLFSGPTDKSFIIAWSQPLDDSSKGKQALLRLRRPPVAVHDSFGHPLKPTANIALSMFPLYLDISPGHAAKIAVSVADAKRELAGKRKRERRKKAFLFDFGDAKHIAVKFIGKIRPFTPVSEKNKWRTGKNNYGFEKGAIGVEDRKWVRNDLYRDGVRCGKNTVFKLRLPKGRYTLEFGFDPFGGDKATATVSLAGKTVAEKSFKPAKKLFKIKTSLTVSAKFADLEVRTSGTYSMWRYITIIENDNRH